jgi:hypothetical protein
MHARIRDEAPRALAAAAFGFAALRFVATLVFTRYPVMLMGAGLRAGIAYAVAASDRTDYPDRRV